ncbi:MAG: response regulator [Ignavibacteria bacterium]|nr:response regulator [Ignavibacteria bacterium]
MLALIIDDELSMRSLLQAHCKPMNNVRTITARNGQEGLEVIQTEQPDIIFSDLNMPVMDGHTLWQILRADAKTQTIPFVLITSEVKADGKIGKNKKEIEHIGRDPHGYVLGKSDVKRERLLEIIESVRPKP